METKYKPVVATQEMSGFTIDELRFVQGLGGAIKGFARILNGERPKESTQDFLERLVKEADEMKAEDISSGKC